MPAPDVDGYLTTEQWLRLRCVELALPLAAEVGAQAAKRLAAEMEAFVLDGLEPGPNPTGSRAPSDAPASPRPPSLPGPATPSPAPVSGNPGTSS